MMAMAIIMPRVDYENEAFNCQYSAMLDSEYSVYCGNPSSLFTFCGLRNR